jgi:aminoglycoside phosphotransferase (APT) family kinase protein
VARGRPQDRYPFPWAVFGWIDGAPYGDDLVDDERRAARDLAQFVLELRAIDPVAGAPAGGRRPLGELDGVTRARLKAISDVVDVGAATAAWEQSLRAPVWKGRPVWIHADLLRPNLLVDDGRLSAVIDFGSGGVGDPAADVIAAWSVFGATGRATFRDALGVDDGAWHRARGVALHQAAGIISYYRQTNPGFVEQATRTVQEILADVETGS